MIHVRWEEFFFVMAQYIGFPHIGIFSFSHRECINLQIGSSWDEMYLNSTFKGFFLCVKIFWPIIRVAK